MTQPATHRRQLRRYEGRNHARSLTFSCFQRRPFLASDRSREWVIRAIQAARARHAFHLWSYTIMPEHVHMLVFPADPNTRIGRVLSSIKQSVSKRALVWVRANAPEFLAKMADDGPDGRVVHRFWQRGAGYDRNLWSPRRIWNTINYFHDNAVNRGLCATRTDWPWSSAREFAEPGSGPIPIDFETIPPRP